MRSCLLKAVAAVATVAAFGGALGACGPTGTSGVLIAWSFADGRDCSSAGTPTVRMTVRDLSTAAPISCFDGSATLQVASSGSKATVVAQDFVGVTLYRGEVELPSPPPSSTTVILRFTGGP